MVYGKGKELIETGWKHTQLWLRDDTFDCILNVNAIFKYMLRKQLKIKHAAVCNSPANLTPQVL